MPSHGHPTLTDECAGCGATIDGGNHRVEDGEAFCNDCEPLQVVDSSPDFEPPATMAEYEANRGVLIHVGELLADGAEVR